MLSTARLMCQGLRPALAVSYQASIPLKAKVGVTQFAISQCRMMAQDARGSYASRFTRLRRPTLKERAMGPATDTAFNIGQIAVAGGSLVGIGALCFYGLGLANEPGAIDRAGIWPDYVRQRVKSTYLYFAGNGAIAFASACAVLRSPRIMSMITRGTWPVILGSIAVMIGTQAIVRSIPYEAGLNMKHLAWILHAGALGAFIAPLSVLGGAILVRAAWYTAGVVGGLSAVAVCAPSERFLNMGGPLAVGLGVVFAASLGSAFLPATTALGAGLYSISLYGGLLLFSAFLLYDTQKIIRHCEGYPVYAVQPYDPINHSINIFIDTVNIFIRIATILAGGGSRRK